MHKTFEQIGEALKSVHFKGSGKFYHRVANSHVILVQFGTTQEGQGFTVTYGCHPLIDNSNKIHHRDYRLENCRPHHLLTSASGQTYWAYHMEREELGELIGRLLSGINALENA